MIDNKVLGMILGSYAGAPTIGYHLGARKFLAIFFGVIGGVAALSRIFGYEAPPPPKPRECVRYETQTKDVVLSDLSSARMTAQFCVEWEKR